MDSYLTYVAELLNPASSQVPVIRAQIPHIPFLLLRKADGFAFSAVPLAIQPCDVQEIHSAGEHRQTYEGEADAESSRVLWCVFGKEGICSNNAADYKRSQPYAKYI